jgi:nitrogen fixation protein FixH
MKVRSIRSNAWALAPAVLLTALVGLQLLLVRTAASDPSFAVEDDYYAKAISWDARMDQERENARLGFTAEVQLTPSNDGVAGVRVALSSKDGSPVAGAALKAQAFFVASANQRVTGNLVEAAPGVYEGRLRMARSGLWEVRLSAERGADRFTHVVRRDLSGAGLVP